MLLISYTYYRDEESHPPDSSTYYSPWTRVSAKLEVAVRLAYSDDLVADMSSTTFAAL